MRDPGVRIAAAIGLLAGGIVLALMFRHGASPVPAGGGEVKTPAAAPAPAGRHAATPARLAAQPRSAGTAPRAAVRSPLETEATPPLLASAYPGAAAGSSAWGGPLGLMPTLKPSADATLHTHAIVDGDTLGRLAEGYLGSADRYLELYELNRDVLASPDLLPIGVELKIPPPERQTAAPLLLPRRPMVPVAHGTR